MVNGISASSRNRPVEPVGHDQLDPRRGDRWHRSRSVHSLIQENRWRRPSPPGGIEVQQRSSTANRSKRGLQPVNNPAPRFPRPMKVRNLVRRRRHERATCAARNRGLEDLGLGRPDQEYRRPQDCGHGQMGSAPRLSTRDFLMPPAANSMGRSVRWYLGQGKERIGHKRCCASRTANSPGRAWKQGRVWPPFLTQMRGTSWTPRPDQRKRAARGRGRGSSTWRLAGSTGPRKGRTSKSPAPRWTARLES